VSTSISRTTSEFLVTRWTGVRARANSTSIWRVMR
jgi:hypothetical protein